MTTRKTALCVLALMIVWLPIFWFMVEIFLKHPPG